MAFPSSITIVVVAIILYSCHEISSFTTYTTSLTSRQNTEIRLFAKKSGSKKTKKNGDGGSGGGFGTKTNAASTTAQVRSVSGHAGSGEKPLRTAANTFDSIRAKHGKESTHDVYCYSPDNDRNTFWFVGKIAIRPGTAATAKQAALSQKRLILEYAKRELRPQNFGGIFSSNLELWLAPGDTEMDAVQNKPHTALVKVVGTTASDLAENFSVKDVGYNPEIYVGDEVEDGGLRIKRDPSGKPIKPVFEVNQSM